MGDRRCADHPTAQDRYSWDSSSARGSYAGEHQNACSILVEYAGLESTRMLVNDIRVHGPCAVPYPAPAIPRLSGPVSVNRSDGPKDLAYIALGNDPGPH